MNDDLATIFYIDDAHRSKLLSKADNSAQSDIIKYAKCWDYKVSQLKIFVSSKRVMAGLFQR
jgi:hypothetical protein